MDVPIAQFLRRHAAGDPGLAAGVSAIVAGDVAVAAQRLAEVVDGRDDPALRVRAAAYHRLATHLRWNAFPGGGGAGSTEVTARWDGEPSAVDTREDWGAVARQVDDPAVTAEARAVGGALCALASVRSLVGHAAARLTPADVDTQLEEALRALAPLRDIDDAGFAALASADLARRARRPERAMGLLREAAAAYGGAGDDAGLGACHLLRGDWRAAPASSPEARNLTVVTSASESSALDWSLEAAEADRAGLDVEGAAAAYSEADAAFAAADVARGRAAVTLRRSHLAALSGDHDQAVCLAGRAAAAAMACHDHWGAWLARTHEALSSVAAGRLAGGDATVEQVGAWGAGPGSYSYALGLGVLCARAGRHWLHRRADPERALACHRLAHTLFVALGAVTDQAQSRADRGRVLHVVGDLAGAADAEAEALALLAADLDARPATAVDNRLRAVCLAQRLYLLHLTRRDAAGMARAADQLRAQAARLAADAPADSVEGRLAAAAHAMVAEGAVLVPLYRGETAQADGDAAAAQSAYAAALEAVHTGGHADPDHLEAVVLGHWRRYPEASAAFERHLDVASARHGLVSRLLARFGPVKAEVEQRQRRLHEQAGAFFRQLRDHKAAVVHFEALESGWGAQWWAQHARPWELLSDYATVCEGLGELHRALALHEQAIAHLQAGRARRDRREARPAGSADAAAVHAGAARCALRLHELAGGVDGDHAGVDGDRAGVDGDRAGVDGDHAGVGGWPATGEGDDAQEDPGGHGAGADPAGADPWAWRAFRYAERGRAHARVDRLADGVGLAPAAPGRDPVVGRWHETNAERWVRQGMVAAERTAAHPDPDRLGALREQIAGLTDQQADLEADLAHAAPAFAATVASPTGAVGVPEVRAALAPRTALLAYHHADEDVLAWAVTADRVAAHRQTACTADLARAARAFDAACAGGRDGADGAGGADGGDGADGAALARILLAPFADVLAAVDRLVVVPAEACPAAFHALPWGDGPLGASHTVTYLPGAGSLRVADAARVPVPGRPLVVGDPASPAWQALPGESRRPAPPRPAAATEAAVVASTLGAARLLTGHAATRAAVADAAGAAPVLHVAAPMQVRPHAPLLSSVLLAGGDALSVYDLLGSGLPADWVVLSAYDAGRDGAAEDVLAVAGGLLGAGARGVVVGLWPVAERTTCVLMARFYRLLRGGAPAPVALQQAQAHLRAMTDEDEAAEFASLQAVAADPAAAPDVLAALPVDPAAGGAQVGRGGGRPAPAGRGGGRPAPAGRGGGRPAQVWAGFCYVGR